MYNTRFAHIKKAHNALPSMHAINLYSHGSHMSVKIMFSSQKGKQIWHNNTISFHIHTNKEL